MIRRAACVALLAGLALSGCTNLIPVKEQVTTVTVPHSSGGGLDVTSRNGFIIVRSSPRADIQIIATLRMTTDDRLAGTIISANRDSTGTLIIAATPPGGTWLRSEGCGFDVTMPEVTGVAARSSNGRIEITGTSGSADLQTSNGAIIVNQHAGNIKAKTSNGRVEITDVSGTVKADTSNGAVRVTLSSQSAGPVDIDTSNGAVTLQLGASFAGTVSASTSNGSITGPKQGSTSFAFEKTGRSKARLRVGSGGEASTIRSSNGSITIRFAE